MIQKSTFIKIVASLFLFFSLFSCGPNSSIEEDVTDSGSTSTVTAAVVSTPTTALTDTPSPTPEPIFEAGIPATIEECNRLQIYNAVGELDASLIASQMEALVAAERIFLDQNAITGADISTLSILQNRPFSEPEKYPYDYIRAEGLLMPVSCTLVEDGEGGWRLMVGLIIKQKHKDIAVAILHVLADHPGLEKIMSANGEEEKYKQKFSPQAIFDGMIAGPRWYVSIRPWVPTENENPDFFADWAVSTDLIMQNKEAPVVLNAYLMGVELDPSLVSENILRLEKLIFPAQWLSITAVK